MLRKDGRLTRGSDVELMEDVVYVDEEAKLKAFIASKATRTTQESTMFWLAIGVRHGVCKPSYTMLKNAK